MFPQLLLLKTIFLFVSVNAITLTEETITKCNIIIDHFFELNNFNVLLSNKQDNEIINFMRNISKLHLNKSNLNILNRTALTPNAFLIIVDEYKDFEEYIEPIIFSKNFDSRAKYIIIVTNSSNVIEKENLINNITATLWKWDLYKSAVIFKNQIYYRNLNHFNCNNKSFIKTKKIGNCSEKSAKKLKLIHENIQKNYKNCPLKILWAALSPWVISINGSNPGIYISILNLFGQVSGIKIVYTPENQIYKEELSSGFSFDTAYKDIESGVGDIFIGLGNNLASSIFDTTNTITDDNLYWAVPKPKKLPFVISFMNIFAYSDSAIAAVAFIISTICFSLLVQNTRDKKKYADFIKNFFMFMAIILNVSVAYMPKVTRNRIFLVFFIILSFFYSTLIQVRIYDIMRNPPLEESVTDLEKIIKHKLPIYMEDGMSLLFINMGPTHMYVYDHYSSLSNYSMVEMLVEAIHQKNFATVADRGSMIVHPYASKFLNIFQLTIFQTCMYMKKHHVLFEYFNKKIQDMVEYGFVVKIEEDAKHHFALKGRKEFPDEKHIFKIELEHVTGFLFILGAGYALSITIFLVEIIFFAINKKFRNSIHHDKNIHMY